MAFFEKVQCELQIEVGALTPHHQVVRQFTDAAGICFAIYRDIVCDFLAGAVSVLYISAQVIVDFFVFWEII